MVYKSNPDSATGTRQSPLLNPKNASTPSLDTTPVASGHKTPTSAHRPTTETPETRNPEHPVRNAG